jgi:RNA polymerase sigma-70 factor (ECF subfamily)
VYREYVDAAQIAEIAKPRLDEPCLDELRLDELWNLADPASVGLSREEFAAALPEGASACLHLADLALARACLLGREQAWLRMFDLHRASMNQAAIAIARSEADGLELADELWSRMAGVQGQSPLAYYSGRGSLKGFLRAALAQRNVDRHRRAARETPLEGDVSASESAPPPDTTILALLTRLLTALLAALLPEDRFILSAWFLDRRAQHEIARFLGTHEATVSRRIRRLTESIRKDLLRDLRAKGMSRRAAEEALGTDPRDLDLDLRTILQASQSEAFLKQGHK